MKTFVIFLLIAILTNSSIFDQYHDQAAKIAQSMTIEQKIGQIIQINVEGITQKQITNPQQAIDMNLGSLLIAGNAAPTNDGNMAKIYSYLQEQKNIQAYLNATAQNWKKMTDRFKDLGVPVTTKQGKKYSIKLLFGTDAVHGDQHSVGSVIFPHNIGLSCTHNEDNFQNLGYWTKEGVFKSGFNYVFAPCVATSHNPQWGRFYQSLGQQTDYIYKYSKAFTKGLQDVSNGKIKGVLGSAKHFFADGATQFGANQGSATVLNYKNFIDHNTQGYKGSISQEVGSVMVSYSAINFIPNSFNSYFLQGLLRDDLGFGGFTISDYDELQRAQYMQLPRTMMNLTSQQNGLVMMINAGVDMIMLSGKNVLLNKQVQRVVKQAKKAINRDLIFQDRLKEAVTRILAVKMSMGLVTSSNEQPQPSNLQKKIPSGSSGNEYQDSLTAVQESLVLLKNDNLLPVKALKNQIKYVVLVGQSILNINRFDKNTLFQNFDNIGMQCGGWSVRWQGFEGNDFWTGNNKISSNASSIFDALKDIQKQNNFTLVYPQYSTNTSTVTIEVQRKQYISSLSNLRKNMTASNTLIIGVFGQVPYAQSEGDVNIKYCKESDDPACLYDIFLNAYVSGSQLKDLTLGFSKFQEQTITAIRAQNPSIPLVSVLLTGRPMPIPKIYQQSTAVLAAWLPGTSGGHAIINSIVGDYIIRQGGEQNRKNSLSMDWPKSMEGLSNFPVYGSDGEIPRIADIQFKVGYGLSTQQRKQKNNLLIQ